MSTTTTYTCTSYIAPIGVATSWYTGATIIGTIILGLETLKQFAAHFAATHIVKASEMVVLPTWLLE